MTRGICRLGAVWCSFALAEGELVICHYAFAWLMQIHVIRLADGALFPWPAYELLLKVAGFLVACVLVL